MVLFPTLFWYGKSNMFQMVAKWPSFKEPCSIGPGCLLKPIWPKPGSHYPRPAQKNMFVCFFRLVPRKRRAKNRHFAGVPGENVQIHVKFMIHLACSTIGDVLVEHRWVVFGKCGTKPIQTKQTRRSNGFLWLQPFAIPCRSMGRKD